MKAEAATPKSVDERVPRDSSFVLIYRINPENQRLDRREREREPNKQSARNQNETLAVDLATITGPEVTHRAVDFGFDALDLGVGAHGHRLYVITVGLDSNLNNLWALLWAFA